MLHCIFQYFCMSYYLIKIKWLSSKSIWICPRGYSSRIYSRFLDQLISSFTTKPSIKVKHIRWDISIGMAKPSLKMTLAMKLTKLLWLRPKKYCWLPSGTILSQLLTWWRKRSFRIQFYETHHFEAFCVPWIRNGMHQWKGRQIRWGWSGGRVDQTFLFFRWRFVKNLLRWFILEFTWWKKTTRS